jgi:hypothetical protein
MDTAMLDAAFRMVAHTNREQQFCWITTDGERLGELRRQFPAADPQVLEDANTRARQLSDVATEMADLARGPRNDGAGLTLNEQTLAARCPGFSDEIYAQAISDGYMLTK